MDKRFKNIESELNYTINSADIEAAFSQMDALSLDQAFVDASNQTSNTYQAAYWDEYLVNEKTFAQDANFQDAANATKLNYQPYFWNAAEMALINEGLHFEYKSTYWNEAAQLLHKTERTAFFKKWIGIASLLLMVAFAGNLLMNTNHGHIEKYSSRTLDANKITLRKGKLFHFNAKNGISTTEVIENNSVVEVEKQTSTPPVNAGKQNKRIVNNKAIVEQTVPVESNTKIPLAMKSMKETYNSQVADNYIIKARTKTNDLALLHSQTPPSIQENNDVRPFDNSLIKIITPVDKNRTSIALQGLVGLGNTPEQNLALNKRYGLNLLLSRPIGKRKSFEIMFQTGFDYEALENYTVGTIRKEHFISGENRKVGNYLEFKNIIKWQSALLGSFKINKKFKIISGLAFDQYVTSQIKVKQTINNETSTSVYQWGRNNDQFKLQDFQLINAIAYRVSPSFSANLMSEYGLTSKETNKHNKNLSLSIGLTYHLLN